MLEQARDRSTFAASLKAVGDSLRTGIANSRLGRMVPRIDSNGSNCRPGERTSRASSERDDTDREPDHAEPDARTHEAVLAGSALGSIVSAANARTATALETARLATTADAVRRYARSSFSYRWLTAEPDPDVVVIDLRETRTVGPWIAVLDRSLRELTGATPASILTGVAGTVASVVRNRPIAVVSLAGMSAIAASVAGLGFGGALTPSLLAVHLLAATVAAAGLRSRRSLDELLATRIATALAAAFEPPEPPRTDDEPTDNER